MNRSSKKGSSAKGSSRKGSSRKSGSRASSSSSKGMLETAPSLVVLSPDVIDTPFMRRRFNPTEKLDLPKPAHFFNLTNSRNKKKESEEEDVQIEKDSELDNEIPTDQERMELAKNNKGSKKPKNEYTGVGAITGLDLTSIGGPNLTNLNGSYMDNNLNLNNLYQSNNNNDNNKNNNSLTIKINTKSQNKESDSENDTDANSNKKNTNKTNKKKQIKFNANGQVLSDESSNNDDIDLLDDSLEDSDNENKNTEIINGELNDDKRRKHRIKNPNTGEYEYEYDIINNNEDPSKGKQHSNMKKRRIKKENGEYDYEYYDENENGNNKDKDDSNLHKNMKKRRVKNENGEYEYEYYDENEDGNNKDEDDSNLHKNMKKRRVKNENGEYDYEYYDENEINKDEDDSNLHKNMKKRRVKNENGEYDYEYFDENEIKKDEDDSNLHKNMKKRRVKNENGEYDYEYYDENEDGNNKDEDDLNLHKNMKKRRVKNENGEYDYEYYDENENGDEINKDTNEANLHSNMKKRRIKNENGEYEYEYYDENEDEINRKENQNEADLHSNMKKRRIKNENGEYEYEYYDENETSKDGDETNLHKNMKKRRVKNENGEYEYEYYDENETSKDGDDSNLHKNMKKRRVKNENGEYEYEYYDENENDDEIKKDEDDSNLHKNMKKRRVKNENGEYDYEYYDENEISKDEDEANLHKNMKKRRVKNENGEYDYEYYDENEINKDEDDSNLHKNMKRRRIKNENGEYEYEYYDENEDEINRKSNDDPNKENTKDDMKKRRRIIFDNGQYEYESYSSDADENGAKIMSDDEINQIVASISDSDNQQDISRRNKKRVKKSDGGYEYEYEDEGDSKESKTKNGKEKHRGTTYNSDDFDSDNSFDFENNDQIIAENKKEDQDNEKHAPRRNVSLKLKNKKQSTKRNNNKYDPDFNNFPERRPAVPGRDFDEYSVSSITLDFNSDIDNDDLLSEGSSDKDEKHVSFNDPESLPLDNQLGTGDNASVSTNAFSVFNDGPEFVEKVHRQLNFEAAGQPFEEEFDKLDQQGRRVIGRLGRLQAVQKRNWLSRIWKLYDRNNNYNDDAFWRTLEVIMNDGDENSDTNYNGLNNNNNSRFNNNSGFNGNNNGFNNGNNSDFYGNKNGFNNGRLNGNNNGFNNGGFNGNDNDSGLNRNGGRSNRNNEYLNNFNEINKMGNFGFDDSMSSATSKTAKSSISSSSWRSKRSQKGDNLSRSLMLNGMISSAREVLHQFIEYTPALDSGLPPSLNFRAAILGPRYSGKTTFLRSLFLQTLVFLANTGNFKSTFVVPFDARDMNSSKKNRKEQNQIDSAFDSRESFYLFVSSLVVEALLIQRPDLQLFTSSLTKAFRELLNPSIKKPKKLPKPISSQDYLRHPMQCVDRLLTKIHALYIETLGDNNNNSSNLGSSISKNKKSGSKNQASFAFKSFLKEVIELPISIAGIFGFDSTLVLFDHFDLTNVTIDNISLADLELEMLDKCQYILSVEDTEKFNKIMFTNTTTTRGRTKSISGNSTDAKKIQENASKSTRSMSFGSKGKKVIDSSIKDVENELKQKNKSFAIKNFFTKMVRVPVTDTCYSSFADNILDIELEDIKDDENQDEKDKNKESSTSIKNNTLSSARLARNFKSFSNNNNNARKIPIPNSPFRKNISISADFCGGCPTFVSRFDDICNGLLDLQNTLKPRLKLEKAVVLTEKVEILLDLLIGFGPDQTDGPPPVKTVTMRNKDEE